MIPGSRERRDPASSYIEAFGRAWGARTLNRLLYTNAQTYLPDELIPKMDRMTMADGLEERSPFLDTDLAVFAASLPDRYGWRGRAGKRLLKSVVASSFPAGFMGRPKRGFALPLDRWFMHDLKSFVGKILSSNAPPRSHLDGTEVDRLVAEHAAGTRATVLNRGPWSVLSCV